MLSKLNLVRPAGPRFSGWIVSAPVPRRLVATRDPTEGCSGLGKEFVQRIADKMAFLDPRDPVVNQKKN